MEAQSRLPFLLFVFRICCLSLFLPISLLISILISLSAVGRGAYLFDCEQAPEIFLFKYVFAIGISIT